MNEKCPRCGEHISLTHDEEIRGCPTFYRYLCRYCGFHTKWALSEEWARKDLHAMVVNE